MNVACSPIGAQTLPRLRNSQPSASATGIRDANPTIASESASPADAPLIVRTWTSGEEQGAADERPPIPERPRPGGRRERAEEQLLPDRAR